MSVEQVQRIFEYALHLLKNYLIQSNASSQSK